MTYKIGQQVETPLGVGEVKGVRQYQNPIYQIKFMDSNFKVMDFEEAELKPYKTAHDKLLSMGFEMVLDDEHFTIFEHQELDYTIRIDKLWKGIGIHHYNDDPHYRYIYLELSRILTQYLEEMAK